MKVLNKKLIIKTIIYRLLESIFIFAACMMLTRKMYVSIIAGIAEFVFKMLLYYVYEIGWKKIIKIIGFLPKRRNKKENNNGMCAIL